MEFFAMKSDGNSELCSSLCRLCLKADVVNLNIFGKTGIEKQISMKLNTCFPLNISETDDKRTHNICFICCLTLEATYKLRQKAIKSDKLLRDLLQRNQNKVQGATLSTNIGPPVQKKMRVQCSTNLSKSGAVTASNMPQSQAIPTPEKENEPLHFTAQLPVEVIEKFQPPKKQHKQTTKKLMKTPTNKQVDVQCQDLLHATVISNDTFSAQTPRSIKPQVVEPFPDLIHSPKPLRAMVQRKRHRENLAISTVSCISDEVPINADGSTQINHTTVPITPKRNEFSQKPSIKDLTNTAEKCKVIQKCSNVLQSDNSHTPLKKSLALSRTRTPLTEKVISLENHSEIDLQTPKSSLRDKNKMLTKNDARNTLSAKCTINISADKKRESGSSARHILENSVEQKFCNVLEPCNENTVNTVIKHSRGAVERCINENRSEARGKAQSKPVIAKDSTKKMKNQQHKMKILDEYLTTLANKAVRNLYEFNDSPDMDMVPKYTPVKQIAKRPTIFDTSEVCFETRPVEISEKRDLGTNMKPQQGNSSSMNHGTPSPSNNEGSESSFGTFGKDLPSSQSEEHITPMRSMTKLLPEDVRNSWKKASGTWASQSINIESEDPFNYGELGACMATGDIFGAGIARKMTNRVAVDDSSKLKIRNVTKRGITKGTCSVLSSLSSPSSAPSSLNLSSGDDSVQNCILKSTQLKENPMLVPKTPGNLKQFETWQAKTKSPTKPLNLQAKVGTTESALSAEGSSQTDSSDFCLTPEFGRLRKQ